MKRQLTEIVEKYLEGNYLIGSENKIKMISEILDLFGVIEQGEKLCQCTDSHEFTETYEKEYCRKCDGRV